MNKFFRATCISILGLAAASGGFLACSSTDSTTADGGPGSGDGGGGGDGNPANGDGGAGSDTPSGYISLVQAGSAAVGIYNAGAAFGPRTTPLPGTTCINSPMMGNCSIVSCTLPPDTDAGLVLPMQLTTKNAGTVTIAGPNAPAPAVLTYGAVNDAGAMGYPGVRGMTLFYMPGDAITVTGAGGTDLPAFGAQSVVAPTDITVTSPACAMSACPDLDRTKDLVVTWTGGGAGNVDVTFESESDTNSVAVSCRFSAASGTGTLPTAVLMKLLAGPDVSGLESVLPTNESLFNVGTLPTRFVVIGQGAQGLISIP